MLDLFKRQFWKGRERLLIKTLIVREGNITVVVLEVAGAVDGIELHAGVGLVAADVDG